MSDPGRQLAVARGARDRGPARRGMAMSDPGRQVAVARAPATGAPRGGAWR
jgi:hypothetical protein